MTRRLQAILEALTPGDERDPFVVAVRRGASAPNFGEAFYAGYQAALGALVGQDLSDAPASFCVTERGGGHPRSMLCSLKVRRDGFVLDGEKSFVTGADRAATLFVVAREDGVESDHPLLRLVRVSIDAPGLTFHSLPPTPFAPTISHARIELTGVTIRDADVLPGDGYARYVKPFRTVEDIHVVAALAAHIASFLDAAPDEDDRVERLLAIILALAPLSRRSPLDPSTHRALAGALDLLRVTLDGVTTSFANHPDAAAGAAATRDLALLGVAEVVRRARLSSARAAIERD